MSLVRSTCFYPKNEKSSIPYGAQDSSSTSIRNNLVLGAIPVVGAAGAGLKLLARYAWLGAF